MPLSPVFSSSLSYSGWSPLFFCAAIAIGVPRTGPLRSCRRPPPLLLLLLLLLFTTAVPMPLLLSLRMRALCIRAAMLLL